MGGWAAVAAIPTIARIHDLERLRLRLDEGGERLRQGRELAVERHLHIDELIIERQAVCPAAGRERADLRRRPQHRKLKVASHALHVLPHSVVRGVRRRAAGVVRILHTNTQNRTLSRCKQATFTTTKHERKVRTQT